MFSSRAGPGRRATTTGCHAGFKRVRALTAPVAKTQSTVSHRSRPAASIDAFSRCSVRGWPKTSAQAPGSRIRLTASQAARPGISSSHSAIPSPYGGSQSTPCAEAGGSDARTSSTSPCFRSNLASQPGPTS
jgi:hypothetical protein